MTRNLALILGGIALIAAVLIATVWTRSDGVARVYYVAADEVEWDYLPTGINQLTGEPPEMPFYRVRGIQDTVLVTSFEKALYREYTDSTFSQLAERPPEWQHLGFLGPLLRGVVGDTIVVHFKNNTAYPVSMHPHGVMYDKDSEGAPYRDGTDLKHDDGVPPGEVHTYVWPLTERSGPGPIQPTSIVWPYHSHTKEFEDVMGGLMGAIVVTARGEANPDGTPRGVDREFVTYFTANQENFTHYFVENMMRHVPDSVQVEGPGRYQFHGLGYHAINGYMYANLPTSTLTMREGERVRWYLFSGTGFNDFHTPHWHGGTVMIDQKRMDVADLGGPLLMTTADMIADNPGIWIFHCHFAEHMEEGMSTLFEILPSEELVAEP